MTYFHIRSWHSDPHEVEGKWVDTTTASDRFTPFAANGRGVPIRQRTVSVLLKMLQNIDREFHLSPGFMEIGGYIGSGWIFRG